VTIKPIFSKKRGVIIEVRKKKDLEKGDPSEALIMVQKNP
jgi:hypothetical protein